MKPMMDPDALAMRSEARAVGVNRVYNFIYGWMAAGLAVSGLVAWMVANAVATGSFQLSSGTLIVCLVAEIALVFALSFAIHKLAPMAAAALFMVYAALNGVTLSILLLVYDIGTIQTAFFATAGTFAAMAVFGTVTKRDLSTLGRVCMMAVIGLIVASLVNVFMRNTGLQAVICYVGVAAFVGLTAYDAQKVRELADAADRLDAPTVARLGILGALQLYLDFINLFIYLVQILGRSRE
ncbi:MAG TPA: Bax inhibitor-1/YccA family protein [Candidatus Spyradenecus faecavium]|uniref:Bax inhibitor-1/YccA family protein n=1 Tax=Candidatus Spyradenecus faecavium TaxID=2840947 RepID=A0A9D1NNC4_9BACT|nr:Bax inhibitor-1/YccA family protein [Candidatus Spyradenecus faecavium]